MTTELTIALRRYQHDNVLPRLKAANGWPIRSARRGRASLVSAAKRQHHVARCDHVLTTADRSGFHPDARVGYVSLSFDNSLPLDYNPARCRSRRLLLPATFLCKDRETACQDVQDFGWRWSS